METANHRQNQAASYVRRRLEAFADDFDLDSDEVFDYDVTPERFYVEVDIDPDSERAFELFPAMTTALQDPILLGNIVSVDRWTMDVTIDRHVWLMLGLKEHHKSEIYQQYKDNL